MATLESVSTNRPNLTFIGLVLFCLPGLECGLGSHGVPSFAAFALQEHENRPDLIVGRLHYSLSPTLSAHFRRGFSASEWRYLPVLGY